MDIKKLAAPSPAALLLLSATLCLQLSACSDEEAPERPECYFDADCISPTERCDRLAGACVKVTQTRCTKDQDCAANQSCALPQGVCQAKTTPTVDMGDDLGAKDMAPNQEDMPQVNNNPGDTTAPTIAAVDPEPYGAAIAPEQQFKITFSERMDPISISQYSILLEDSQGSATELEVSYDGQLTATATPKTSLAKSTAYKLTINTFARDLNFNALAQDSVYSYVTDDEPDARLAQLAQTWAPWIHQGIDDLTGFQWRADMPSSVDFDGDFEAGNNQDSMLLGTVDYRAKVYYHVTESPTHLFIYYVLYYPKRVQRDDTTGQDVAYPHDMTGAVFVVDKAEDKLVIVEGLRVGERSDTLISYTLSGSAYDAPSESIKARFNAGELIDAKRFPWYIPAKRHESCNFKDDAPRPPIDVCFHDKSDFPGGPTKGAILKPGAQGQSLDDATVNAQGIKELSYELIPLSGLFWLRRNEYGPQALFDRAFTYSPAGTDRPAGFDDETRHLLPNKLYSATTPSFGKTPFRWLYKSSTNNPGQWLMDPAYELRQRYTTSTWSEEYCDNLFFNIKRTDLNGCTP